MQLVQQQQLLLIEPGSEVDEPSASQPNFAHVRVKKPKDGGRASVADGMKPWHFFVATAAVVSGVGGLVAVASVSGLTAGPLARRWVAGVGGQLRRSELLLGIPLGTNSNDPELLSLAAKVPHATCSGRVEDSEYVADAPVWHRHVDHVDSPDRCCALCTYFKRCQSWTWVRDAKLTTGNPSQCWLKGGTPGRKVHKAGVVSGLRQRPEPQKPPKASASKAATTAWRFCPKVMPPLVALQHCSKVDEHTDYVDEHPWKWHVDHVPNPGDCCSLCSHFPQCRAWTWVEDARLQKGCPAQCWLKGLVGNAPKKSVAKQGVISGLRAAVDLPASETTKTTTTVGMHAATAWLTTPSRTNGTSNADADYASSAPEISADSNGTNTSDVFEDEDIEWPTYAKSVIEGAREGKPVTKKNATTVAAQADFLIAEDVSTSTGATRPLESPVQQQSPTVATAVFMVPDGTAAEDAVAAAAMVAQATSTTVSWTPRAAGRQAPRHPKELTFYMYRATGEFAPPLENVNAADLAGVMLYLHREVVGTTPRKFGIDRIRRYRVTVRNTQELFNVHHSSLGPYLAFEEGQCTSPLCERAFKQYGYVVGCQRLEDSTSAYQAKTATAPGKCESNMCHLPVWYSLPGPCPIQRGLYRKRRLTSRKLSSCIQAMPGGLCKKATGKSDCTYSVEEAGYVLLDELLGISDYASWCRDGRHKEYDQRLDRGIGTDFWNGKQDAAKCAARMAAVQALFKYRYPRLPEHLHQPPCDFDMYYEGEFS